MQKVFIACAGVTGLLATLLGAFGAHALKHRLAPELMQAYQTGVAYQFAHALALLLVALLMFHIHSPLLKAAGLAFIAGIILFSGSLTILAISGNRALGAITPVGGMSFILGWLLVVIAAIKHQG